MQQTGVKMVHAPYRGGPLALNDLIAGHIQLIIEVSPVVNEQVRPAPSRASRSRSPYRLPRLPNVPTFAEAGVPGVVVTGWLGIYGPPGCRTTCATSSARPSSRWSSSRRSQKKLRAIGFEPTGQGVEEFTAHHAAEVKRWVAFYSEVGLRK